MILRGLFFEYDEELGQVSKRSETPKGSFLDGHKLKVCGVESYG
jgi:hypothetical protein